MEIHLYRLDDTAFRLLILWRGDTVHRGLFEAANYTAAMHEVHGIIARLESDGKLSEGASA